MDINNPWFVGIGTCLLAGIAVVFFQEILNWYKKKKVASQIAIAGNREEKVLLKDFIYQYVPGEVSYQKLVEEIGIPISSITDIDSSGNRLCLFKFRNAKVEVINNPVSNDVKSITLFSTGDKDYPVNCRMSFEEEDTVMGIAEITDVMLRDSFRFEANHQRFGVQTILGCVYSHVPTRYLDIYYQVDGEFEKKENLVGQKIIQVCVSSRGNDYHFFSSEKTMYW